MAGKDLAYDVPPYVPGLKGECDVDIFMGTIDELRALAGYDEPVPEPGESFEAEVLVRIGDRQFAGHSILKEVDVR